MNGMFVVICLCTLNVDAMQQQKIFRNQLIPGDQQRLIYKMPGHNQQAEGAGLGKKHVAIIAGGLVVAAICYATGDALGEVATRRLSVSPDVKRVLRIACRSASVGVPLLYASPHLKQWWSNDEHGNIYANLVHGQDVLYDGEMQILHDNRQLHGDLRYENRELHAENRVATDKGFGKVNDGLMKNREITEKADQRNVALHAENQKKMREHYASEIKKLEDMTKQLELEMKKNREQSKAGHQKTQVEINAVHVDLKEVLAKVDQKIEDKFREMFKKQDELEVYLKRFDNAKKIARQKIAKLRPNAKVDIAKTYEKLVDQGMKSETIPQEVPVVVVAS